MAAAPAPAPEAAAAAAPRACLWIVISGGQTGADRAALEAARVVGLRTGGWAPPGFWTCRGPAPELGSVFGLRELPGGNRWSLTGAYVERSKRNVDDADATLLFRFGSSPGTDMTYGYCETGRWEIIGARPYDEPHRPNFVVGEEMLDDDINKTARAIAEFIVDYRVRVLNVAGHRDGARFGVPRFDERVRELLVAVFKRLLSTPETVH